MNSACARFSVALRPQKLYVSLRRGAQDGHLDFHTAPELWECVRNRIQTYIQRFETGLGLRWDYARTALGLRWDCARTALGLRWDCARTALGLRWGCARTALGLRWDCARTALGLRWDWTAGL